MFNYNVKKTVFLYVPLRFAKKNLEKFLPESVPILFIYSVIQLTFVISYNIYPTPGGNRAYTIVGRQKESK